MYAQPEKVYDLAGIDQFDLRYNNFDELITSIYWHLYFSMICTNEMVDRIGGSPLDNQSVQYTGSSDDAALNDAVARYQMPPSARQYLRRNYDPTGRLRLPVLTLHNTRDPLVPAGVQDAYRDLVASNGCSEWLRQEFVDRQDHIFTGEETVQAILELVAWAEEAD